MIYKCKNIFKLILAFLLIIVVWGKYPTNIYGVTASNEHSSYSLMTEDSEEFFDSISSEELPSSDDTRSVNDFNEKEEHLKPEEYPPMINKDLVTEDDSEINKDLAVGESTKRSETKEDKNSTENKEYKLKESFVIPLEEGEDIDNPDTALAPDIFDYLTILKYVNKPYEDSLGFKVIPDFSTEKRLQFFEKKLQLYYQTEDGIKVNDTVRKITKEQIDIIRKTSQFIKNHESALKNTVISVPFVVNSIAEKQMTNQYFEFDNIQFTGLAVKTDVIDTPLAKVSAKNGEKNRISLSVYLETDDPNRSSNIMLCMRQIGVTDNNSSSSNTMLNVTSLSKGYNNVTIDLNQLSHYSDRPRKNPFALYISNNSGYNAKIRITAQDIWNSDNLINSAAGQPNSAAPISLGTQLKIYPVFQYSNEVNKDFQTFLTYIRNYYNTKEENPDSYLNMVDLQFDRLIMSGRLSDAIDAYKDVELMNANSFAERIRELLLERIDFFDRFDGVNRNSYIVSLFTSTVSRPSVWYAIHGYYHLRPQEFKGILRGELSTIYSWVNNHEYGHMIDNNYIVEPEMTNNLFSIAGNIFYNLKMYRENKRHSPILQHHQLKDRQRDIDFYLDSYLKDLEGAKNSVGSWKKANIFQKTLTIYTGISYFDYWEYHDYNFSKSPFTPELVESVKKFGVYGTMMNAARKNQTLFSNILPNSNNPTGKYYRIVALSTYATGYNMSEYFKKRGLEGIPKSLEEFCSQYPKLPVPLEYFSLLDNIALAFDQEDNTQYIFKEEDIAGIVSVDFGNKKEITEGHSIISGEITLHLGLKAQTKVRNVSGYEIYYKGKKIGFTRNNIYKVQSREGDRVSDYSARAIDQKLNFSPVPYNEVFFDLPQDAQYVVPKIKVDKNKEFIIPEEVPEREGYSFKGWKLADKTYLPKDIISSEVIDSLGAVSDSDQKSLLTPKKITLSAIWESNEENLEVDKNMIRFKYVPKEILFEGEIPIHRDFSSIAISSVNSHTQRIGIEVSNNYIGEWELRGRISKPFAFMNKELDDAKILIGETSIYKKYDDLYSNSYNFQMVDKIKNLILSSEQQFSLIRDVNNSKYWEIEMSKIELEIPAKSEILSVGYKGEIIWDLMLVPS